MGVPLHPSLVGRGERAVVGNGRLRVGVYARETCVHAATGRGKQPTGRVCHVHARGGCSVQWLHEQWLHWVGSVLCILGLATLALAQQPITFQYFYDELGQLVKVVDSTGVVIEYVYDAVGNILEIKRSTIAGLAILDFSPKQGPVGLPVTVQGQGFSATPATNLVQFNGITATVTAATATTLV